MQTLSALVIVLVFSTSICACCVHQERVGIINMQTCSMSSLVLLAASSLVSVMISSSCSACLARVKVLNSANSACVNMMMSQSVE